MCVLGLSDWVTVGIISVDKKQNGKRRFCRIAHCHHVTEYWPHDEAITVVMSSVSTSIKLAIIVTGIRNLVGRQHCVALSSNDDEILGSGSSVWCFCETLGEELYDVEGQAIVFLKIDPLSTDV